MGGLALPLQVCVCVCARCWGTVNLPPSRDSKPRGELGPHSWPAPLHRIPLCVFSRHTGSTFLPGSQKHFPDMPLLILHAFLSPEPVTGTADRKMGIPGALVRRSRRAMPARGSCWYWVGSELQMAPQKHILSNCASSAEEGPVARGKVGPDSEG